MKLCSLQGSSADSTKIQDLHLVSQAGVFIQQRGSWKCFLWGCSPLPVVLSSGAALSLDFATWGLRLVPGALFGSWRLLPSESFVLLRVRLSPFSRGREFFMNCDLRSVSFSTQGFSWGFSWAVFECMMTETSHTLVPGMSMQGIL